MTEFRDDVPLQSAMLLWDDGGDHGHGGNAERTKASASPLILDHSLSADGPENFDNATGACFSHWREMPTSEQLAELMRDAWMAVVRDKVDPQAMHHALLVVPEFRAILHPGDLPPEYQVAGEPGDR